MDDINIPDEFINFDSNNFKKATKKDGSYKKAAAKSGFVITINPNISHKTLTTPESRKALFVQLTKLSRELEANFRAGKLLKEKPKSPYENGVPPTIDKYKCNPEIGKAIGFMHLQGVVTFNGTTYIDLDGVRDMIRNSPNGFKEREPKVQFRWFAANNEETLMKYIDKDYESKPETRQETKPNDTPEVTPNHTPKPTQQTTQQQTTQQTNATLSDIPKPYISRI